MNYLTPRDPVGKSGLLQTVLVVTRIIRTIPESEWHFSHQYLVDEFDAKFPGVRKLHFDTLETLIAAFVPDYYQIDKRAQTYGERFTFYWSEILTREIVDRWNARVASWNDASLKAAGMQVLGTFEYALGW